MARCVLDCAEYCMGPATRRSGSIQTSAVPSPKSDRLRHSHSAGGKRKKLNYGKGLHCRTAAPDMSFCVPSPVPRRGPKHEPAALFVWREALVLEDQWLGGAVR